MTEWYDFSNVNSSKMLSFDMVAEAHGPGDTLIVESPWMVAPGAYMGKLILVQYSHN